MKKFLVIILCLVYSLNIWAQVAGSGKVSVKINNKSGSQVKMIQPVTDESIKITVPQPEKKKVDKTTANQNKGIVPAQPDIIVPVQPEKSVLIPDNLIKEGKYYALIIGINNYDDPLVNDLDYCIRDAESFYKTLTWRYTFEPDNVKLLKDANYSEIMNVLDYFARVVKPIDNFIIFYAGHGYWLPTSEIGFWLPSDAQKTSRSNWFRNSALRDYLREINSKHTLLITDACFSGSIFKTRNAFSDASIAINKLYELPSRKAMTSGTLTEVPDQSAFLKYMIDRLEKNNEKYYSSEQLFSNFRMAVINNSRAVPQYGVIQDVGDEGGDFIFILR